MAGEENFLSRWSRRKSQAAAPAPEVPGPAVGAAGAPAGPPAAPGAGAPPAPAVPAPLPSLESLTPESDFAPFMAAEVDGDTRRKALKTLFADPRFNVMDMMDVYVDDYSKPDPIPASWLDNLEQLSRLGDRAGRDREEAERLRALAEEEREAATHTPPADTAPAGTPAAVAQAAEGDGAAPPRGAYPPGEEAQISPRQLGESGG